MAPIVRALWHAALALLAFAIAAGPVAQAQQPARPWRIGLVGYGEVGRILAEDLRAQGVAVAAHDLRVAQPETAAALAAHAKECGVQLAQTHASAVADADLVICAVTASQTVAAARSACAGLKAGAFFLDFNSASPGAKAQAAEAVNAAGGRYVEGAVMTSVPPYRIRVPLLLGGPNARALEARAPAMSERYAALTKEAIDRGVFGAPSYVIDGEIFWGQDRLDFVARKLAK